MIAIIDYRAGNLTSVKLALDSIGAPSFITSSPEEILNAKRIIFPGVGAAGSALKALRELNLEQCIIAAVKQGTPFLGICLGTQIIFEETAEDGGVKGLGIVPGKVLPFKVENPRDKVPQMGWNQVKQVAQHPLFANIEDNSEFYFVHSFYPEPSDSSMILGTTEYSGTTFASMVGKDNLVATQFHPEKSGRIGMELLKNFVQWTP